MRNWVGAFWTGAWGKFIEIMPARQQVHESRWYSGSAGAAFRNLREIRRAQPDYVLGLSGDHIFERIAGWLAVSQRKGE